MPTNDQARDGPRGAKRSLRHFLWRLILLPMLPLVLLALLLAGDSLRRQHEADARNATLLAEHLAAQVDRLLARHVLALQMLRTRRPWMQPTSRHFTSGRKPRGRGSSAK